MNKKNVIYHKLLLLKDIGYQSFVHTTLKALIDFDLIE